MRRGCGVGRIRIFRTFFSFPLVQILEAGSLFARGVGPNFGRA